QRANAAEPRSTPACGAVHGAGGAKQGAVGCHGEARATSDAACQGGRVRRGGVKRRWQRRRARRSRAGHTVWGATRWSRGSRSPGPPICWSPAGKQCVGSLYAGGDEQDIIAAAGNARLWRPRGARRCWKTRRILRWDCRNLAARQLPVRAARCSWRQNR
ncbi:unnamed protein product, partial [Ectocarpus sp. 13 AM-2016]